MAKKRGRSGNANGAPMGSSQGVDAGAEEEEETWEDAVEVTSDNIAPETEVAEAEAAPAVVDEDVFKFKGAAQSSPAPVATQVEAAAPVAAAVAAPKVEEPAGVKRLAFVQNALSKVLTQYASYRATVPAGTKLMKGLEFAEGLTSRVVPEKGVDRLVSIADGVVDRAIVRTGKTLEAAKTQKHIGPMLDRAAPFVETALTVATKFAEQPVAETLAYRNLALSAASDRAQPYVNRATELAAPLVERASAVARPVAEQLAPRVKPLVDPMVAELRRLYAAPVAGACGYRDAAYAYALATAEPLVEGVKGQPYYRRTVEVAEPYYRRTVEVAEPYYRRVRQAASEVSVTSIRAMVTRSASSVRLAPAQLEPLVMRVRSFSADQLDRLSLQARGVYAGAYERYAEPTLRMVQAQGKPLGELAAPLLESSTGKRCAEAYSKAWGKASPYVEKVIVAADPIIERVAPTASSLAKRAVKIVFMLEDEAASDKMLARAVERLNDLLEYFPTPERVLSATKASVAVPAH